MVALIASTMVVLGGVGIVMFLRGRRPNPAPLTWGEAMLAAAFVFAVMFFAFGVVPHQWLTYADSELGWRADRLVYGPGDILDRALPFTITYRSIRDLIVAGIYVVFVAGMVFLWALWQKRGRVKPAELETSAFGRPLVKVG